MANSAYSARPTDLSTPVPVDEEAKAAAEFFKAQSAKVPDVTPQAAAPVATAADTEEAAASAFFGTPPTADAGGAFAPETSNVDPRVMSGEMVTETAKANLTPQGVVDQITNFKDRLVTGFAGNDREKLGYLRDKYGKNNVQYVSGKIYFRKDPKGKFQNLDPSTLEVINDVIADFAGDAIREVTMLPGELAGGAAGFVAGGFPGAAVGARAARVASVPLANRAVNKVGEVLGLKRDEGRSQTTEDLVGMGAEAVLPVLGKKLARFLPGSTEHRAAEQLARGRNAPLVLNEASREFVTIAKELEESGAVRIIDGEKYGIPGINVPVFAHQIEPDNPSLMRKVGENRQSIPLQNVLREQGRATQNLVQQTLRAVAPDNTTPQRHLGLTIKNAVEEIGKKESADIGKYRAKALAQLGNGKQQLPAELSERAVSLMRELGFQSKSQQLKVVRKGADGVSGTPQIVNRTTYAPPKDLQPIIGRLGLDDSQTRQVVNVLNEYGQLISRGNEARLTDVERLVKRMGDLNPKLRGSALSGTWGSMTGTLRQHRRAMIESGLPDDVNRAGFNEVMDKYSAHRETIQNIADSVNTNMGSAAVVQTLLGKGKESVGEARALGALLKESHPEAWNSLKAQWADQTIAQFATDKKITGVNTDALLTHLAGKDGKEMLGVLFDGTKHTPDDLIKTVKFAKRINDTNIPVSQMSEAQQEKLVKEFAATWLGSTYIAANSMFRLMKRSVGAGGPDPLTEILSQNGIDKYITGLPAKKRSLAARKLREYLVVAQESGAWKVGERMTRAGTARGFSNSNTDRGQIQVEENARSEEGQ